MEVNSVMNAGEMRECRSLFRHLVKLRYHKTNQAHFSTGIKDNLKPPWKILFFGTDDFAMESLKMLYSEMKSRRLVQELSIICAQSKSPVSRFGLKHDLKLINWKPSVNEILETRADIGLVASFGHLIPSQIISAFPLGMLNVHASILPRWRGAAPIVHAVMHRDIVTGVTIMKIRPHNSYVTMFAAPKVGAWMAVCDWAKMSGEEVYARHRALTHLHPLQTTWQGKPLRLLECAPAESRDGEPGSLGFDWQARELVVTCRERSAVRVRRLKLPGKAAISAVDFFNGYMNKVARSLWRFG
ncbi:hypothetical protein B566_EDAN010933 [Ephemera danica]|nr:hypothetical protein B566_EDAN010933 [Ephemera danica]